MAIFKPTLQRPVFLGRRLLRGNLCRFFGSAAFDMHAGFIPRFHIPKADPALLVRCREKTPVRAEGGEGAAAGIQSLDLPARPLFPPLGEVGPLSSSCVRSRRSDAAPCQNRQRWVKIFPQGWYCTCRPLARTYTEPSGARKGECSRCVSTAGKRVTKRMGGMMISIFRGKGPWERMDARLPSGV